MVALLLRAPTSPTGVFDRPLRQSKTTQVMLVLLDQAQGELNAITGRQIRMLTRMVPDDVHRVLSGQAAAGRISRRKPIRADGKVEMQYWLNPMQAAAAEIYRAPILSRRMPLRSASSSPADLAAKLKFLIYCKESTSLGEFKLLDLIIADYRDALKRAATSEE
ncbi:hypothetical protein [Achromobacter sp. DH1f]|uniref:hypothetical protein n=1 Tax=Achromobacter sp. DH1f TaxID=1397275 RepID=UPI00046B02CC|nr:hypothetical protein [Achromobacter sp. DH1f]